MTPRLLAILCLLPVLSVPPRAQDEAALARGLDAIRVDRLRADVHFFASDQMKGRNTPSPELRVAARFIAARLERLGFTPGAGSSWFHLYDIHRRGIDPATSRLVARGGVAEAELAYGRDYFVTSSGQMVELTLSGPLVYCGDGDEDVLDGIELEGSWALCVDPGKGLLRLQRRLRERRALGLVLIGGPDASGDPIRARYGKRAVTGEDASYAQRRPDEEGSLLSVVFVTRSGERGILGAAAQGGLPAVGVALGVTLDEVRRGSGPVAVENVGGLWPGSDPELAKEVIVVTAHYDHVGARPDKIFNGADDNASGSMGLLGLAEGLVAYGPMRRSVLLLWVSGEEKGLWGSEAWARDPSLPDGMRAICNVNIDMIGRNDPDSLLVTPSPSHGMYNGLSRRVHALAEVEGFERLGSADLYWQRSDHFNFSRHLGLPVVFLFADVHEDYHRPSDTADKLDYGKARRATALVLRLLDQLQGDELDL